MLCSKCGQDKPTDLFSINRRDSRGYCYNCKACESDKAKEYYKANRDKRLEYRRKYLYGVNEEVYQDLLKQSGGVCEICKEECTSGRALAVDHCHNSQEVRGLLCTNCNTALGSFKDDIDLMKKAIEYLERFK
jgi:hypothetical protein